MLLKLRAGERLFINGAVLKVERKATIELLNDANFLLEAHVIQPGEADTPLRQLYFVLQTQLMERETQAQTTRMFTEMLAATCEAFGGGAVIEGLRAVGALAESGRTFEALKTLRALFAVEAELLKNTAPANAA